MRIHELPGVVRVSGIPAGNHGHADAVSQFVLGVLGNVSAYVMACL
jgi:hypothetical protein